MNQMNQELTAKHSITVKATGQKVWTVITSPETLQQVMLGMQPKSEWTVGAELRWIGRHEEKPGDNAKGIIEQMEPAKRLQFTFFYPGYGYPDQEQNYNTVVFNLIEEDNQTTVNVEQGDFSVFKDGATYREHSQRFWEAALQVLKTLAEG